MDNLESTILTPKELDKHVSALSAIATEIRHLRSLAMTEAVVQLLVSFIDAVEELNRFVDSSEVPFPDGESISRYYNIFRELAIISDGKLEPVNVRVRQERLVPKNQA